MDGTSKAILYVHMCVCRSQARKDVLREFAAAEKVKKLPPQELFNDVYAEMPEHLQRQMKEMDRHLEKYGSHYPLGNHESG